MSAHDGGMAFPTVEGDYGMSLRDYFATHAMTALLESNRRVVGLDDAKATQGVAFQPALAAYAYGMADAMLAERSKQ